MSENTLKEYKEYIDIVYKSNSIILERCELYCDFLVSLAKLIDDTFLGFDTMSSVEDMFKHFTWCFNRVTEDYEKERIHFIEKGNHYKYLWFFFWGSYYNQDEENKIIKIVFYFRSLFDINYIKTEAELNAFIDLYKIFDQNLKK